MAYSLKEGLRQALLANAPLVALVGSRISSGFAPRTSAATGPWIVFTQISGREEGSFSGDDGLTHPRFQLTVGGPSQVTVDQVRDVLVYQFHMAQYVYTGGTGTPILTFIYETDGEQWDPESREYKVIIDFFVWANR